LWQLPQGESERRTRISLQAQGGLELKLKGDLTMFSHTRNLSLAAAGALIALTAVGPPARADELTQNLGPVGPHEPILTTVGNKRVIAFYEPDNGHCALHAVVWNTADLNAESTSGFQVDLNPRQMVRIDAANNESLNLQCGDNAESLAIVDTRFIAAGAAN
jgi:hypothetical protein